MKKLIVGNWKMNPQSGNEALSLFVKMKRKGERLKKTRVVICPPTIFIERLIKKANSGVAIGAQDTFWEKEGAYTGKIASSMLKKAGVSYVICGHSEMRALGDTNDMVNKKIREAFLWRLIPILCVGERTRDDDGRYLEFIEEEIKSALFKVPKKLLANLVVAYEPIWAIGEASHGASTPEDFLEKSIFIRKVIAGLSDKEIAMSVPILYGGSVDEYNAFGFLSEGKGDGLLLGRASLDTGTFGEILSIAESL